jgi:hypothetical protein
VEREVSEIRAALYRAQQGGYVPLDEAVLTKNDELAELLRSRGAQLSGAQLPERGA